MVLDLGPDRQLRGMIGAEGKSGDGFEIDIAGPVGVEEFGG
jgi:hypothetical protein